jgi:4,4'-diaponeurosporenoate glycosyltransferase
MRPSDEERVSSKRRSQVSFTVALCLLGWLLGWWALGRPRRVDDLVATPSLPPLTIVVPARNEAASIGSLLGDLGADPALRGARVVVVDDHSTDDTAAIAAGFDGVEVLTAPALPPGWAGKPWACHCGATATAPDADPGDLLVFLDADVRVRPGALPRLVGAHAATGGLLSVQPRHETRRWYEQLSAVFNVVAMMGVGTGDPNGATGAFGPLLITSRDDYLAVGGHGAVRGQVVEDLALAARYRESGRPLAVLDGGSQVRFRMYPEGLGQLVEGWTKNFAVGAGATPPLRLLAIVIWVTAVGSAAFSVVDVVRGALPATAAWILYVLFVGQLFLMFRQVGRFRVLTSVLFPIPLAFFLAVFVRSLWSTHVRRSVTWRGRSISTVRTRG